MHPQTPSDRNRGGACPAPLLLGRNSMTSLSRIFCAALLALFAGTFAYTVAWAQGDAAAIGLSPVRYDPARPATQSYYIYEASPSLEIRDEVRVRNSGNASGTVRLYAVDGTTSDTSGSAFRQDRDPRQGVATWVQVSQQELTLAPGEERTVPFTVTIPADVRGGQHLGGLVAEDILPKSDTGSGQFQVTTSHRTIVAIQVNLPGTVVERLSVNGVSPGGSIGHQLLVLGLRNEGNEMVKPLGTLSITDAQGQEVQRLPIQLDTFLPGTAIQYPVAVQKQALGAGQYHAKVDLTYGTSGVTSYEGDFTITAAQVAQVFPSSAPLAPPPVAAAGASAAPTTTSAAAPMQWPLFAGGAVLLVLALAGGIFLGRRGRSADAAK